MLPEGRGPAQERLEGPLGTRAEIDHRDLLVALLLTRSLLVNVGAGLVAVLGAVLLFNLAFTGSFHLTVRDVALMAVSWTVGSAFGTVQRHRARQARAVPGSGTL